MDKKITYFTLIGVASKDPLTVDDGKIMYLKYGPLTVTSEDIKNVEFAKWLAGTELIKTSFQDALASFGVDEIARTVSMFYLSAKVNKCSVHCFKTEWALKEKECELIVDVANHDPYMRKKLIESRIS